MKETCLNTRDCSRRVSDDGKTNKFVISKSQLTTERKITWERMSNLIIMSGRERERERESERERENENQRKDIKNVLLHYKISTFKRDSGVKYIGVHSEAC